MMLIRLGLDRKRLGHESDLHVRPNAVLKIRVEDAIDDRPVVDRLAIGIFGVSVGRAPFQRRRAVAGAEKIVRAEINVLRRKFAKLAEQFAAVGHVRIVRLIRAENRQTGLSSPSFFEAST